MKIEYICPQACPQKRGLPPNPKPMKSYSFYFKDAKSVSMLILSITEGGKRERLSLHIKEDPATFDVASRTFTKANPHYKTLNARLAAICAVLEREIREAEVTGIALGPFRERIEDLMRLPRMRKTRTDNLFIPFFEGFVYNDSTKRTFARQSVTTLNVFKAYASERGINPTFDDMTYELSEDFISWLAARGLAPNTRGSHIKRIKAALHEAHLLRRHTNIDYQRFRKEREDVDSVYLTTGEVERIAALELVGGLDDARDLFLLGCHTGMRHSDYCRLAAADIHDGIIHNVNQKTKAVVEIPAHPRVLAILAKHGGRAPKISQQKFNQYIKDICRRAGITQRVTLRGRGVTRTMEKWEAVTSHTARRTGITNMYKAGVPVYRCMMISGHTTEKVFLSYIKITQEENAALLRDNPFFRL